MSLCGINICSLLFFADHIVRTKERLNRMLSEYTGQPLEKVCQDTERDNFMTAQQAADYGLIDAVMAKR